MGIFESDKKQRPLFQTNASHKRHIKQGGGGDSDIEKVHKRITFDSEKPCGLRGMFPPNT